MELTERLSSEQYKANELQERLTQLESKLHTLSDAIEIKDNELTHVRETLALQNKQLIQNNQLTDRLRHYEAQDSSNIALQEDLRRALVQINELMAENLKLKNEITPTNLTANLVVSDEVAVRDFTLPESEVTVEIKETQTHNDELDYSKLDNNFDKELAMKHLEDKFTRIMVDIANLTEEKHRLEHIVTQLQGETDTIGEYIALYQHQRGILQQRTQEKEEQLKRLTNDRYNVRNKLEMINDLVNKLVQEKGVLTPEILEKHDELCNHSHDSSSEHGSHLHKVGSKMGEGENNNVSNETAGQIIQLLSEIKSSNLVQPCDNVGNFHPCSCCSGQLVTV